MSVPSAAGHVRPYGLRCDHRVTPLGLDEPEPLLSWRLASDRRGDDPVAQRVRVARLPGDLAEDGTGGEPLWDSGPLTDPHAVGVRYSGPALEPRTRDHWQVTVEPAGAAEPTEAGSWFETGLVMAPPGASDGPSGSSADGPSATE
ncbi:hypothetical protein ACFXPK_31965, partial [Streptomyces sp. NPDC059142]